MDHRTAPALLATLLASCGLLVGVAPDASAATVLRPIARAELPGTATPTDISVSAHGGFALALTKDGLQRLTLGARCAAPHRVRDGGVPGTRS